MGKGSRVDVKEWFLLGAGRAVVLLLRVSARG